MPPQVVELSAEPAPERADRSGWAFAAETWGPARSLARATPARLVASVGPSLEPSSWPTGRDILMAGNDEGRAARCYGGQSTV
jgi:hypothetical protein